MNDTDTLADDLRKDSLALMKLLADEKHKSEALAAELAVEKMQHSVTIADEHESRSEFQDRIRALEAERDDVVEARGEMARENVRLATELAEWRELYEFGLKDRNELLDRAQTAEAYAARNALRVIELEAAAEKVHGIIAEYWGPCMGSVECLLTLREAVGERARTWGPKVSDLPRVTELETACESRCAFDTNNGDRCILPDGHEGNHSL